MFAMARQRQSIPSSEYRGGGSTSENDPWFEVREGLKNGLASGLAAACAKVLLQPFDTVKTVQQVGFIIYKPIDKRVRWLKCYHPLLQATKGSLGMIEAGQQLVARKGAGALYSGLGVTLVGSIPAVSVYFGVYQFSKKSLA